jgi:hypothetical protein
MRSEHEIVFLVVTSNLVRRRIDARKSGHRASLANTNSEIEMDTATLLPQPYFLETAQAPPIRVTPAAGEATANDSSVLHAAIGLAEQIRAASDEIEHGRRIPPAIAAAMKDAGVSGVAMPRAWGGPELDPLTQFRVIEALAVADGSVGWCTMIGCDGGYVTAVLDQDVARAMYPDLLVATGAAATAQDERCGCRETTASADAFPSSADANIANGYGWVASWSKLASHRSIATACRKPDSALCGGRAAKSSTSGTPPGSAAPGATTSASATRLSRKGAPSAFRIRAWSRGPGALRVSVHVRGEGAAPALGIARSDHRSDRGSSAAPMRRCRATRACHSHSPSASRIGPLARGRPDCGSSLRLELGKHEIGDDDEGMSAATRTDVTMR